MEKRSNLQILEAFCNVKKVWEPLDVSLSLFDEFLFFGIDVDGVTPLYIGTFNIGKPKSSFLMRVEEIIENDTEKGILV